ncbi:MAG: hypothetical protein V4491_06965 [Pseudomonadota bacterium]
MMLLGALIKQVMRAQGTFVDAMNRRQPETGARIAEEAGRHGMDSKGFVADTMQRFMAAEDSESWTTIVGNIQRSEDPGFAFVETVMRKRLSHQCGH